MADSIGGSRIRSWKPLMRRSSCRWSLLPAAYRLKTFYLLPFVSSWDTLEPLQKTSERCWHLLFLPHSLCLIRLGPERFSRFPLSHPSASFHIHTLFPTAPYIPTSNLPHCLYLFFQVLLSPSLYTFSTSSTQTPYIQPCHPLHIIYIYRLKSSLF